MLYGSALLSSALRSSVAVRGKDSQLWPKDGRFRRFRTRIPDFDRLVETAGHNRLPVRREGHGGDEIAMGVLFLRHKIQRGCEGGLGGQLKDPRAVSAQRSPESQTLIELPEPDTMVFPSGENATEVMNMLYALLFFFSPSVAACGRRSGQISPKRAGSSRLKPPESQTLIVPPLQADTILVPSWL